MHSFQGLVILEVIEDFISYYEYKVAYFWGTVSLSFPQRCSYVTCPDSVRDRINMTKLVTFLINVKLPNVTIILEWREECWKKLTNQSESNDNPSGMHVAEILKSHLCLNKPSFLSSFFFFIFLPSRFVYIPS